MNFINAVREDLDFIVSVYNSTVESRMVTADTAPVTAADKINWFLEHNTITRPLWIIEDDGMRAGWVSFGDFYGRPAYNGTAELSIYLHPSARGKGLGKQVLAHCIQAAPALQLLTLLGFIFAHNQPSIKLFEHAGFELWGHLPGIARMDDNEYSLNIYGLRVP